jgi:predicted glycogen debranching enzyme
MLPNRFPDAGQQPEYNTVDATLWYFEAVRAVLEYTGDTSFVKAHLYDVLAAMVAWHERGTRYGIRADSDGLLLAGEPGAQLTWMDSKIGDWVVTPRYGKPVEIQALWYNALRVMEDLASAFGDDAGLRRYSEMSASARRSFEPLFWNESAGCLYDVVDGDYRDAGIRPNHVFAVSLPNSMLSQERARSVVSAIEHHLLTPFGLRSLAPGDPHYRGRYEGDPRSRDSAYHQGTVWPWLMGPFVTAYSKVHGAAPESLLAGLRDELRAGGLGHLPEVYDGDFPHRSGGCIAQAWSAAELLRAMVESERQVRQASA